MWGTAHDVDPIGIFPCHGCRVDSPDCAGAMILATRLCRWHPAPYTALENCTVPRKTAGLGDVGIGIEGVVTFIPAHVGFEAQQHYWDFTSHGVCADQVEHTQATGYPHLQTQ
jgi:hypothetical protein